MTHKHFFSVYYCYICVEYYQVNIYWCYFLMIIVLYSQSQTKQELLILSMKKPHKSVIKSFMSFLMYLMKWYRLSNKVYWYCRREHEFKVDVKFDATKDIDHLHQFLSGRQRDNPHETNQALDILLTKAASREYVTIWHIQPFLTVWGFSS